MDYGVVAVLKLFYEMYPASDPKYWSNFKFVKRAKGIDVYYRSDRGTVRIVKGKNDEDPRWRKVLHSSPPKVDTIGTIGTIGTRDPTSKVHTPLL